MSNIIDVATRTEIRRLERKLDRISEQLSVLSKSSNLQVVTQSDFNSHKNDTTIHFTESSIDHDNIVNMDNNKHIHVGASAPTGSEILWLDTSPDAPYSTLEMKLSGDSGSTWQRIGIGW